MSVVITVLTRQHSGAAGYEILIQNYSSDKLALAHPPVLRTHVDTLDEALETIQDGIEMTQDEIL